MNHFAVLPNDNRFSHIFVDLTHRCNMSCANCYVPNRTIPDLDKNTLFEFAKRLPSPVTFRLIGGEPTLRPDLCEIISQVKQIGHQCTLFTNGLKLSDENLVISLKQAGLDRLQLSMNGGTLDSVYLVTDKMKAAKKKTYALENLIRHQIITSVGLIVVNEDISGPAIGTLVEMIESTFERSAPRSGKSILIPSIRFRNVGAVGRHMTPETDFESMVSIVQRNIGRAALSFESAMCGSDYFRASKDKQTNSLFSVVDSKIGPIYVKITNWSVDDEGVIDAGSNTRGRLTKDWRVAPFFEDIKANEFGY